MEEGGVEGEDEGGKEGDEEPREGEELCTELLLLLLFVGIGPDCVGERKGGCR